MLAYLCENKPGRSFLTGSDPHKIRENDLMTFGKRKKSTLRKILKWLTGILLLAVFIITTGIYNIYRVTSPDIAIPALGRIMETAVQGISMGNIDHIRDEVIRRGSFTVEPVAGIPVSLDKEKIQDIPVGEFRSYFFREAAAPLYTKGAQNFISQISDSGIRSRLNSFSSTLQYLAEGFHSFTGTALMFFGALTLLLFVSLVFLSYRFGKLVSSGIILILAGTIGFAAITFLKSTASYFAGFIPGLGGLGEKLTGGLSQVTGPMVELVTTTYLMLLLAGGALLVTAFFGKWIYNIVTGKDEGED